MKFIRITVVCIFHALPILPILLDLRAISVASLLMVALPYIKTKKLEAKLADLESSTDLDAKESLSKTRDYWRYFTLWKIL